MVNMEERAPPSPTPPPFHPFAKSLLRVGAEKLTGNLTLTSEGSSRELVFLFRKGVLLKATGLVSLGFFLNSGEDLGFKGDPTKHEVDRIKGFLRQFPLLDVWWAVALQASNALLSVASLPGKKRVRFRGMDLLGIDEVFRRVGAGIRMNEEVVSLFFPPPKEDLEAGGGGG